MMKRICLSWMMPVAMGLMVPALAFGKERSGLYWPDPRETAALRESLGDWSTLAANDLERKLATVKTEQVQAAAERLSALYDRTGEVAYARRAARLLDHLLADAPTEPWRQITAEGSRDAINLEVRDLTFLLALRHHVTDRVADAATVREILLEFARVVPDWPLWDRQGNRRTQNDARFFRQWDGRGIWGGWFHMDLERSEPLLRAYDLVRETLAPEDQALIREGLFDHQARLIARWEQSYSNMIGNQLIGLLQMGLTLPEPAYVHQAIELYEKMIYIGFFPDGFFREVSPSYHTMPVGRMTGAVPALVQGYCDPPGYVHPETGRRLENVDLAAQYARHHQRWWQAWDKLTLPNHTTLAVNDSLAGRRAWWTDRDLKATGPRLLGTSGIGVLGHGAEKEQMEAYLLFSGTHNHEHYDNLNLVWWAHGREVFSETNYRPLRGSNSTREWHTMSAGHNLVVIDGKSQHGRFAGPRRTLSSDDALLGMATWQHRNRSMNHGNLLLFDPAWDEVQVMEAEGERAYYPTAQLYRRTVAMVALGAGDGYLLDIFRVRGGSRHDYVLHGGLDEDYRVEHSVATQPASGVEHQYIQLSEVGWAEAGAQFAFVYPDGLRTTSRIVAPTSRDGSGEIGSRFLLGQAPAMRRQGEAPFVMLRRLGGTELAEPGAENTFVLVHEAHRGVSHLHSAELVEIESDDSEAVAVRVLLQDGREDLWVSTLDSGTVRLPGGATFHGRLGVRRQAADGSQAMRIFDGHRWTEADGSGFKDLASWQGTVLATRRQDLGDALDAVVVDQVLPEDGSLLGRTLHVDLGDEFVWSYRIMGVSSSADGRSSIAVEHDPGFEIREGGMLVKMVYYPGWGLRRPALWRIAGSGAAALD